MKMIVSLANVSLLGAVPALAQSPAAATSTNCSEANMNTMHDENDRCHQTVAVTKEMDMAKDMMAKKDEKGCMAQMDKATGMMK